MYYHVFIGNRFEESMSSMLESPGKYVTCKMLISTLQDKTVCSLSKLSSSLFSISFFLIFWKKSRSGLGILQILHITGAWLRSQGLLISRT